MPTPQKSLVETWFEDYFTFARQSGIFLNRLSACNGAMPSSPKIQLSEFCSLFDADDRQVRYIIEEGFVPNGVEHSPSAGNRREFGPGHAFWLAIVLKLKQTGLKTAPATDVADFANRGLRSVAQNLSWDRPTGSSMVGSTPNTNTS
jgi:hypothetical protein